MASASYAEYRQRGGMAKLTGRTLLVLRGADRVRYLNGQATADVRKLKAGETLYACVTTAKGKICADVFLTASGESIIVDADPAVRESLAARLERYIVADDVEIEDASDRLTLLHILSEQPVEGATRSNRFGVAGWDLMVPAGTADEQAATLAKEFPLLDAALLESIRMEHGIPRWGAELDENTLPPEAGLDRTAIDYAKGCYIGQEVISRIKSVGHVNRELVGFSPATKADSAAFTVGAKIVSASAPDRSVGELTSTGWSFALSHPIALGYLKRGAAGETLLACSEGTELCEVTLHQLPFYP